MKILLTGAGGQVGQSFIRYANEHVVQAYTHQQLDIANLSTVEKIISLNKPDIVINAAAYTQVDQAEKEIDQAFRANEQGAKNIALVCHQQHIPLIHLSTDYIFSGEKQIPYTEADACEPLSIYGKSKLRGELAIQELHPHHIILRVSGVFSCYKTNFVKKMLELGQQQQTLNIVDDQFLCPTAASDIAQALSILCKNLLLQTNPWGTYHFCSSEVTSWFNFADAIFSHARKYASLKLTQLNPISSKDYPTLAKRPQYSALNCEKINACFGLSQPSWHHSLKTVIAELLT